MKIKKQIKGFAISVLPRSVKIGIVITIDSCLAVLASWLSVTLWTDHSVYFKDLELATVISISLLVSVLNIFGLYGSVFRFLTKPILIQLAKALALYAVVFFAIVAVYEIPKTPRSIGLVQPFILIILIVTVRIMASKFLEVERDLQRAATVKKYAILGAGEEEIKWVKSQLDLTEKKILCFIDETGLFGGSKIFGIPTMGWSTFTASKISRSVEYMVRFDPDRSRTSRREVNRFCFSNNVGIISNPSNIGSIANIDPGDLLNRDISINVASSCSKLLYGQNILITGAAGSIGSELARQVWSHNPRELILVDFSEHGLYQLRASLNYQNNHKSPGDVTIRAVLANICDEESVKNIFKKYSPTLVFHAAAYKHVEMVEHNTIEGIKNNVLGTWNLAKISEDHGVTKFILISSDKAVRPTSVMGASKRASEMILQALSRKDGVSTTFSMVRFGNVLASSGSVLPKFYQQIMRGGPITVTDEGVVRFFMTIPEAVHLVIEASEEAEGGEVFILDMGDPVRIYELAKQMIVLSGNRYGHRGSAYGEISIEITGLLPGEKMYEELLLEGHCKKTSHPKIYKSIETYMNWDQLNSTLADLQSAWCQYDESQVKRLLKELIGTMQSDVPRRE